MAFGLVDKYGAAIGLEEALALVPVTVHMSPAIEMSKPVNSVTDGMWPSTGQAKSAAIPGAKAGNKAARAGPNSETILE